MQCISNGLAARVNIEASSSWGDGKKDDQGKGSPLLRGRLLPRLGNGDRVLSKRKVLICASRCIGRVSLPGYS